MIAVDAMGGDHAPEQVVLGALLAAKAGVWVVLFGPKDRIFFLLNQYDSSWQKYNILISNTNQQIGMGEDPVKSFKKKMDSSLVQAVQSVKQEKCKAVVSAGNSGALMVASVFILGCQKGIERPAIIGTLYTGKKEVLILDLGANVNCRPSNLVQFAHMADSYARRILGIKRPKVSILSNGHEEGKGSILVKKTFDILKEESNLNFIGNIEPYGIFDNRTDIVVTDGFSGNILLKTLESVIKTFNIKNYTIANHGALLIGINGCVVVVHGNSDSQVIKNAILFAHQNLINKEIFYGICEKSFASVAT